MQRLARFITSQQQLVFPDEGNEAQKSSPRPQIMEGIFKPNDLILKPELSAAFSAAFHPQGHVDGHFRALECLCDILNT